MWASSRLQCHCELAETQSIVVYESVFWDGRKRRFGRSRPDAERRDVQSRHRITVAVTLS